MIWAKYVFYSCFYSSSLYTSGKCDQELKDYEKRLAANGGRLVGAYKPDCKEDGSYRAKQCNPSTAYCWCVNIESGEKIPGTEKQTFVANIDCSEYEEGNFVLQSLFVCFYLFF